MSKVNLDEIDHQILDILIDNTRIPFTDISKRLLISAGTVHVRVKKMEDLLGICDYGSEITAVIGKDNIIGCQFHPEKSQKIGLKFIKNFINWSP